MIAKMPTVIASAGWIGERITLLQFRRIAAQCETRAYRPDGEQTRLDRKIHMARLL